MKHVDSNGVTRVTGVKTTLKKSQSYPADFGAKVASSWANAMPSASVAPRVAEIFSGRPQSILELRAWLEWCPTDDRWEDALLQDAERYLQM